MSLIPWRRKHEQSDVLPGRAVGALRSEFDRLFERFFGDFETAFPELSAGGAWMPSLEVSEAGNDLIVKAELPGVDARNVEVTVSGSILTISGEKRDELERRDGVTYVSERHFGRFQRSIELPAAVDADKVTAENANGVLTIRFPRTATSRPNRVKVLPGK